MPPLRSWFCSLLFLVSLSCVSARKNVFVFEVQMPESSLEATTNTVTVNLTSSLSVLDPRFLSVALGSKHLMYDYFSALTTTPILRSVGLALAPVDLRLGGTSANFLTFNPSARSCSANEDDENKDDNDYSDQRDPTEDSYDPNSRLKLSDKATDGQILTKSQWQSFNAFLSAVGWDLLFDINAFKRTPDNYWDPTNFGQLLNYSASLGIPIPYMSMGNEPATYKIHFNMSVPADILVKDYYTLKNLTSKYPLYANTRFFGPEVTDVSQAANSNQYLRLFLSSGSPNVVQDLSLHQYYLDGSIGTVADFLSLKTLESFRVFLKVTVGLAALSPQPLRISLTETSSCYGGGCADGLSNGYVGGFLWLDKLGLSAQYGLTRVFRQSLTGGSYSLLGAGNTPNPDCYLSILFKKLVAGPVFNISLDQPNSNLRVYANCARPGLYQPGALVLYYLNIDTEPATLSLSQFQDADLDLYLLTPGDASGLTSKYVKLNDQLLAVNGSALPALTPLRVKGDVTVQGQTFGFIVVPNAGVEICKNYNLRQESEQL